jgi:SPP1 gp7 family putative phage head morphogenesis protein
MTTSWTTAQTDGYCTAWPARDFGADKVAAILATGVRAADLQWTARPSYVAVLSGAAPVSLRSVRMEDARLEAIALSAGGPVMLCLRLAAHPSRLLQKIEVLRPDDTGERIVVPSGHAIEKAINPMNPFDFRALVNKIATGLRTADREFARPLLAQYFDRLRVNWTSLGPRQIAQVFSDARAFLGTLPIGPLVGAWQTRLTITLEDVASKTKRVIRNAFLPSVNLSLNLADQEAIADIARQPGLFVRDEFGRRSDALTKKARRVVERGLRDGLGRDAIAAEIERTGAGYWNTRGFNYARVVAANSVSRARSYSELTSYRDAGIQQLEITAVLDERTSDVCRSLDGTIIDVGSAWSHSQEINAIQSPEEIYDVAPFLRETTDRQTGERQIRTGSGQVYADVLRSGVGTADDRGDLRLRMGARQLRNQGVTMPPYHHNCRTFTVPRTSYIQVPAGQTARTYPQPATVPTAGGGDSQRPATVLPEPTQRKPVDVYTPPPEVPPTGNIGKAERTVAEVIQRAMGAVLPAVAAEITRVGRDLTRKEMGRALRELLEKQVLARWTGQGVRVALPRLEGLPFRTTALDQEEAWRRALQFATRSLRSEIIQRKVPTIRAGAVRGYYPDRDLIVVRSMKDEAGLVRAAQFYVDTLGDHRWAGNALRATRALPGELHRLGEHTYALAGPWLDRADGRVWHRDPAWVRAQYENKRTFTTAEIARTFVNAQPTALWTQMAPRFLKGHEEALAVVWERFPEQLAGYMALQSGALLEVSDAR